MNEILAQDTRDRFQFKQRNVLDEQYTMCLSRRRLFMEDTPIRYKEVRKIVCQAEKASTLNYRFKSTPRKAKYKSKDYQRR